MTGSIGKAIVTFDLRTSIIPFALLEICNHFKKMRPGDAIEILCIEPGIERDLQCILPKVQYETVCTEAPAVQRGARVIRLRKVQGPCPSPALPRSQECDEKLHAPRALRASARRSADGQLNEKGVAQ